MLNLTYFTSFLSINLGVMNLIPFPALDGSHLIVLLIEKSAEAHTSGEGWPDFHDWICDHDIPAYRNAVQ